MRQLVLTLAAALALGAGSTAVHANTFLVQADDLTDTLAINTYENGVLIQNAVIGGESYLGAYGLAWDANAFLASDVDVRANIYEKGGSLSDTWQLLGAAGQQLINIPFISDTGGAPLLPLPNGKGFFETGGWQTVAQFTLVNGDDYTWQFRSDAGGVPEPAAWALMLVGLGGLGVAARSRRKAALA
jgi:hypothetical protein